MQITFDSQKLLKDLDLIRSSIGATKDAPGEQLIGLHAKAGSLVAYASGKGQWGRVTLTCEVQEEGLVMVNRQKFFQLLAVLKGNAKLKAKVQCHITPESGSEFTLRTSKEMPPTPNQVKAISSSMKTSAAPLHNQLKLCILDGELLGGGYKLSRTSDSLEIMVSDGLRLIVAKQECKGETFSFTVHPSGIRGLFEVLKAAGDKEVVLKSTLANSSITLEDGDRILEFGFQNATARFPDVTPILGVSDYPSTATFEVASLLEIVEKAIVLADDEFVPGDFVFTDGHCRLKSGGLEGTADQLLSGVANSGPKEESVLRLRLDFIRVFLRKLNDHGTKRAEVSWGASRPVRWTPEKEQNIDLTLIMAPLRKQEEKA